MATEQSTMTARGSGVHPPLPLARPAVELREDPLLRLHGQPSPQQESGPLPSIARPSAGGHGEGPPRTDETDRRGARRHDDVSLPRVSEGNHADHRAARAEAVAARPPSCSFPPSRRPTRREAHPQETNSSRFQRALPKRSAEGLPCRSLAVIFLTAQQPPQGHHAGQCDPQSPWARAFHAIFESLRPSPRTSPFDSIPIAAAAV